MLPGPFDGEDLGPELFARKHMGQVAASGGLVSVGGAAQLVISEAQQL